MKVCFSMDFQVEVFDLDVVYINVIVWVGDFYEVYGGGFCFICDMLFKLEVIVFYFLVWGVELSICLDDIFYNWYFSQVRGVVFLWMVLFICMVDWVECVMDVI